MDSPLPLAININWLIKALNFCEEWKHLTIVNQGKRIKWNRTRKKWLPSPSILIQAFTFFHVLHSWILDWLVASEVKNQASKWAQTNLLRYAAFCSLYVSTFVFPVSFNCTIFTSFLWHSDRNHILWNSKILLRDLCRIKE